MNKYDIIGILGPKRIKGYLKQTYSNEELIDMLYERLRKEDLQRIAKELAHGAPE